MWQFLWASVLSIMNQILGSSKEESLVYHDLSIVVLPGNQIGEQLAGLVLLFYTHFFLADFHHGTLNPMGFFQVLRG